MFKTSSLRLVTAACVALTLQACSNNPNLESGTHASGNPYLSGSSSYADHGQVTSIDVLKTRTTGTVGTLAGAAVGGIAGNQIGGGSGKTVATVAGAIGGALIGRAIEQNTRLGEGADYYRVNVRFKDGSLRYFEYAERPNIRVGDEVYLSEGQLYRR